MFHSLLDNPNLVMYNHLNYKNNPPSHFAVCCIFDDALVIDGDEKRVYVSLGIFSIIRLERRVQLLIPAYDFCVPDKECVGSTDDSPCDLFERISFPVDEFFPTERCAFDDSPDCGCK